MMNTLHAGCGVYINVFWIGRTPITTGVECLLYFPNLPNREVSLDLNTLLVGASTGSNELSFWRLSCWILIYWLFVPCRKWMQGHIADMSHECHRTRSAHHAEGTDLLGSARNSLGLEDGRKRPSDRWRRPTGLGQNKKDGYSWGTIMVHLLGTIIVHLIVL